jgi:bifunctional NMN adenylyltransferase/nudix hydrolase
MKETAILIGRFQIPEMNDGYRKLIETIRQTHDDLVLVLAEPKIPASKENPLPLESRMAMIAEAFPELRVLSLKDHPLDEEWSRNLDELLDEFAEGRSLVIYGSKERFIDQYRGKHKTAKLSDRRPTDSGVEEDPSSKSFRRGMVYAAGKRYASVFPTVDVAVFREKRSEILLAKKDIDGKWRLIGGFADPSDEGFAVSAKRELQEECGDIETSELTYEGSFRIDDWRYRFEQDKIITTLFSADYICGSPQARDDVAELDWFSLDSVPGMMDEGKTALEHGQMFRFLLTKYRKEH